MEYDNGTNLGDSRPTQEEKELARLEKRLDQFRSYSITVDSALRDRQRCDQLESALRLVLDFHGAGHWDETRRHRWQVATGTDEATTRVMCDHIRQVLAS
jgi:hypothetical protein